MNEMLTRILECMGPHHGAGKELAEHLGISPNVITNWKNGANKSYRKYLSQIAVKYNVSVEWLKGETDIKNKPSVEGLSEIDILIAQKIQLLTPEQRLKLEGYVDSLLNK